MELYEPYHLKDFDGVFGVVDVQSVGGISLLTGGFGAEYGDKLTGVFDMRSRNPPVSGARTSVGLSVSNASVLSRGSFDGARGQWLFQARRGYLDLLLKLTDSDDDDDDDEELFPGYYDVFGKAQYELSPNHRLAANFLYAGDDLKSSLRMGVSKARGAADTVGSPGTRTSAPFRSPPWHSAASSIATATETSMIPKRCEGPTSCSSMTGVRSTSLG